MGNAFLYAPRRGHFAAARRLKGDEVLELGDETTGADDEVAGNDRRANGALLGGFAEDVIFPV